MPGGIFDAMKMLPMVSRLKDVLPKTVKDGPCQEVVRKNGTLDEIPILKCWPEDGGRYITLPMVFTKDPETGMRNIGTYRMQVFDGRSTGMHWQRHKGGAQHYRVAERLGKRHAGRGRARPRSRRWRSRRPRRCPKGSTN